MGTDLKLVDVMTGFPDEPEIPEVEKKSFACPEGVVVSDVDITGKQNVYTLRCRINGKKQPKRILTEDERRWIDAGGVNVKDLAVHVNREVVDKLSSIPVQTGFLFD